MKNSTIGDALLTLRDNLDDIRTVAEWARETGYSRPYFSTLIQKEFGESPYRIICREKYRRITQLVRNNPDRKGFVIARKTGFSDVKSLYKFLKSHFDTTLTALRQKAKVAAEG